MQTYTHAAIGAAAGVILAPHDPIVQALCVTGSMAPDLALVPFWFIDKARGEVPLKNVSPFVRMLIEVGHSLPVWTVVLWVSVLLKERPASFFFGAIVGHLIIDAFTHSSLKFRATDQTLLWPWKAKLGGLIGFWDYRYDYGVLRPKPFEALLFLSLLTFLFWSYAR